MPDFDSELALCLGEVLGASVPVPDDEDGLLFFNSGLPGATLLGAVSPSPALISKSRRAQAFFVCSSTAAGFVIIASVFGNHAAIKRLGVFHAAG